MPNAPERSETLARLIRRRRRNRALFGLFILCVLALGGAWWWNGGGWPTSVPSEATEFADGAPVAPPESAVAIRPPAAAPMAPAPAAEPRRRVEPPAVAAAPPVVTLRDLDASDTQVRGWLDAISEREGWPALLGGEALVRRFVVSVDNISEGKSPRDHLDELWLSEPFEARSDGEILFVDPSSHARYDTATQFFVSLDPWKTADVYERMRPLVMRAYSDLGYPEANFDQTLLAAINELLTTPMVVGEPTLAPRIIGYSYADPELEALSDAQKHFLRMGPTNVSRIQKQLRALAIALGASEESLAHNTVYRVEQTARVDSQ